MCVCQCVCVCLNSKVSGVCVGGGGGGRGHFSISSELNTRICSSRVFQYRSHTLETRVAAWLYLAVRVIHGQGRHCLWRIASLSTPQGKGTVHSVWSSSLLGGSGGVVNSLDFCPASLKSLGCFYFRCVYTFFTMEGGDSEFSNFTLPTLKTFLEARSQNVSVIKQ